MMSKTKIGIGLLVLVGITAVALGPGLLSPADASSSMEPVWTYNVSNDTKLVAHSDNVFVGTVLAETGSRANTPPPEANAPGFSPQTQFKVKVETNVKGNLNGAVTVSQYGGTEDGEMVHFNGDELLKPNQTYLFVTNYNERDDWHTITANSYGDLPISNQSDYETTLERFQTAYNKSKDVPASG